MDNIVLEYRDPLLGVILIVGLIFIISFITYSYGIYKERNARKDYRKLSLRFELGKLKENDYVILDRYVYSNMGHQGGKIIDKQERNDMYEWLYHLEFDMLGG